MSSERAKAIEDFIRVRKEAHDILLAHVEQLASYQSTFMRTSNEIGAATYFHTSELPLGYSVDLAINTYGAIQYRKAAAEQLSVRQVARAVRERELEQERQQKTEARLAERESEAVRIQTYNGGPGAMSIEEAHAIAVRSLGQ